MELIYALAAGPLVNGHGGLDFGFQNWVDSVNGALGG